MIAHVWTRNAVLMQVCLGNLLLGKSRFLGKSALSLFTEFLFLQIFKKLISVAFEKRGLNLVSFDKLLDFSLELELSI